MNNHDPQKIAFVSLLDTGKWGASEYLWSETAVFLSQEGHDVIACSHGHLPRPVQLDSLADKGIKLLERFPPRWARMRKFLGGMTKSKYWDPMHAGAIRKIVRYRPKLVLISTNNAMNSGLIPWCEKLGSTGIPYAILLHTHAEHFLTKGTITAQLRKAFDQAAAVYFVSEDNRSLLTKQLGLSHHRIDIVRNPLAIDRQTQPPWPENRSIHIACVGRLDPKQKGQDILIDCLQDSRWRERPINVGFFGDGPARGRLQRQASSLPEGMITFHGHVENPATIWETHQLLVFPSRYEGLGLAVAEAQLCGRPVVITDCAARELVTDGQTGFIASSATTAALQATLERAWAQRDRWPEMGQLARRQMLDLLPENPAGDFAQKLLALAASGKSRKA